MAFDPDAFLAERRQSTIAEPEPEASGASFDPDAFLAARRQPVQEAQVSTGFDPDAFLAERRRQQQQPQQEPEEIDVEVVEDERLPEQPSMGRVGAGLGTEIAIGEVGRMASAAGGAKLGFLVGGPKGAAVGFIGGWILGGLAAGAGGSIASQRIEKREEISTGRVVRDSLINILPAGPVAKGATLGTRLTQAGIRHGAYGAAIGVGGQIIETGIQERRAATVEELTMPFIMGGLLGGGTGTALEGARGLYRRITKMSPENVYKAIARGDPEFVAAADSIDRATDGRLGQVSGPLHQRLIEAVRNRTARVFPSLRLGSKATDDLATYVNQINVGNADFVANRVDTFGKLKSLRRAFVVAQDIPEEGIDIGRGIVLRRGQELKPGTNEHATMLEYVANRVLEGSEFVDPITGRLVQKQVVASNLLSREEIQRFTPEGMPEWIGADGFRILDESKNPFRALQDQVMDLHQRGIRPLTDELAETIQRSRNADDYLPRIYRYFGDPDYQPSREATAKLTKLMRDRGNSEEEIKQFLANLAEKKAVDPADAINTLFGLRGSGPNVFKARKLTEDDMILREFLGEVTNPGERLSRGYSALQKYVSETKTAELTAKSLFMSGHARLVRDIPEEEIAAGMWRPLRIGGIKAMAQDARRVDLVDEDFFMAPVGMRMASVNEGAVQRAHNYQPPASRRGESEVMIPVEFERAINQLTGEGVQTLSQRVAGSFLGRKFMQAIAASKFVKVVMNPPSYAVQAYGSQVATITNGFNPFKMSLVTRDGRIVRMINNPKPQDFLETLSQLGGEELIKLQRLGMINRSVGTRDLDAILSVGKMDGNLIEKLADRLAKAYRFFDDMWRINNYYAYRNVITEAMKTNLDLAAVGMRSTDNLSSIGIHGRKLFSEDEIDDLAALLTRNTYQDYTQLPKVLRDLSQFGVLGQFASFRLELIRNYWNKANLALRFSDGSYVRDVLARKQSDLVERGVAPEVAERLVQQVAPQMQKALRAHGARMLSAQALAYGGTIGVIKTWNRSQGIDGETESALRELVYDFDRDQNLAFSVDAERGNLKWKNVSYMLETASHTNILQSIARAEGPGDAIAKAFAASVTGIQGEGPFIIQNMMPAIQNYNPRFGETISQSTNPLVNTIERARWYMGQTFLPGVVREWNRATSERRNQPLSQTMQRQIGVRWNDRPINELVQSRVLQSNNTLNTVRANWRRDQRNLTPGLHADAYASRNQEYQDNFAEVIRFARAVDFLQRKINPNHTSDMTIRMLRDAGMPAMEALAAVDGRLPSLPRTHETSNLELWNEISALPANEQRAAIMAIDDLNSRRNVMRRYQTELRLQRRGFTERDRIVRTMQNEERAAFIWEQMQQSDNPSAVLNEYRRKGIATSAVLQQIRLLERQ
ncbi:hypothetical protein RZS08_18650 [Arthrospira platensis SPKY1]|nr:hypothetical protein [Arthrospira platensis SPKY1]